ncbi:hypothetical protein ACFLZ7_03480 [Nanoarchaeota archaeon]
MKKLFTIIAIVLLVAVAGCTQETETTKPATGKAFIGGDKGLELNFLTGAPPSSVFDTDNPFSISLKIENVGEYDIENSADATVEITGINPADFGVTKNDLTSDANDELLGASMDASGNIIQGTVDVIDFEELEYKDTVSGTVPFTLIANICYEYGATAQAKLCILEDLIGSTGETPFCNANNQGIAAESSGAPVTVTSMSENVLGKQKVSFIFKIRNTGTGTLHQDGTECDTSIPARDKVWIEIQDTELGPLKCSGLKDGSDTSGYITLYSNEATVRCTQEVTDPADFEKVVEIKLRYGYEESKQQRLEVKQSS